MLTRFRKLITEANYGVLALEISVVIIGILIALGIDEWRKDIDDAKVAREYIHQLIADLKTTEGLVAEKAPLNSAGDTAALTLVTLFQGEESVEPEEISELFRKASDFSNPVPVLGTAEAMVMTGDIRLIRDTVVRSKITRYLSTSRDYYLLPIYDKEDRHFTFVQDLAEILAKYRIPLGLLEAEKRAIQTPDVEGFLNDTKAYVGVQAILESRRGFQVYRTRIVGEATALRQSLEEAAGAE